MPHFIYPDNEEREPFRGRPKPYHEQDAVTYWLKHYENSKYLTFLLQHPNTTALEKMQASKELNTATKKMEHWKRHVNWDPKRAGSLAQEVDKQWQKR